MFARVVGPYLVIIAATAALRPIDMKALLSQIRSKFVVDLGGWRILSCYSVW